MFKFYVAFYIAKFSKIALKLLGRNASCLPGKIAINIYLNFLEKVNKPKTIIGVTGTNGKTTVCNLLVETLENCNYKVLNNKLGSNINSGVATALLNGCNLFNKSKYEIAVLEIDERSSLKLYPYITPTYLICTNLFRDSIKRNAHSEFIFNIINKNLPKETKLILNADDLISSQLGNGNEKIFFGIDKMETDLDKPLNIVNDMVICPKCYTELQYDYVRYFHIGKAYCPNCDFKSEIANYSINKIDYTNNKISIVHNNDETEYKMISNSIFNIYNMLAAITLLSEFGIKKEKIQETFEKQKIVGSRYNKENVNGIKITSLLAKGQNPIACSCVFDYIRKEAGSKEVLMLLYDYFDAKESTENITWLYDCDFEFLNDNSIEKIIIAGPRAEDFYLRLLIADVPKEKIIYTEDINDSINNLSLKEEKDIYILYDVYTKFIAEGLKKQIKELIIRGDE